MLSYGAFEGADQHFDHNVAQHQRSGAADATDVQPPPARHWRRVGAVACGVAGLTAAVSAVMGGAGGIGGGRSNFDSSGGDAAVAPNLNSVGTGNGDGRLKNNFETSAYPAPTWHPKLRLPTLQPTADPTLQPTADPTPTSKPTGVSQGSPSCHVTVTINSY